MDRLVDLNFHQQQGLAIRYVVLSSLNSRLLFVVSVQLAPPEEFHYYRQAVNQWLCLQSLSNAVKFDPVESLRDADPTNANQCSYPHLYALTGFTTRALVTIIYVCSEMMIFLHFPMHNCRNVLSLLFQK